jgi:hypothetical protein
MRTIIFAGIFALSATSAIAQTGTPPAPSAPAEKAAAPSDPAARQPGGGKPANLCHELVVFMKAPPPEAAPATAQTKSAADAKSATAAANAPGASQPSAEKKAASAGENSGPASGQAVQPESSEKTGSAQEISGQSGPAHGSPEPNTKHATQGSVQNAPQTSSMSAPVPTEPTSPPKDSIMTVTEAEKLAENNDIAACQSAGRKLRLAGVVMPPPLLALTALNLRYQQAGGQ